MPVGVLETSCLLYAIKSYRPDTHIRWLIQIKCLTRIPDAEIFMKKLYGNRLILQQFTNIAL